MLEEFRDATGHHDGHWSLPIGLDADVASGRSISRAAGALIPRREPASRRFWPTRRCAGADGARHCNASRGVLCCCCPAHEATTPAGRSGSRVLRHHRATSPALVDDRSTRWRGVRASLRFDDDRLVVTQRDTRTSNFLATGLHLCVVPSGGHPAPALVYDGAMFAHLRHVVASGCRARPADRRRHHDASPRRPFTPPSSPCRGHPGQSKRTGRHRSRVGLN